MNDYISIISSLIIFIFPYIGRKWFNIQSLSSIAIGLGLLGTFSGIMYGLWIFNVEQIDFSIPILIESIKTALLTSIAGMFSSLLLKISPSFYGIKEKVKQEEITDKQLFELLTSIEKNTRTSTSSELIQTLKQQYEQLENSYQILNNTLLKQTAQEIPSKAPSTIIPLDNLMSEQMNQMLSDSRLPLYEKAVVFAAIAHQGARRKGSRIPYLSHPIEAAAIVSELAGI